MPDYGVQLSRPKLDAVFKSKDRATFAAQLMPGARCMREVGS